MPNTCSRAPLHKQTATIILISALLKKPSNNQADPHQKTLVPRSPERLFNTHRRHCLVFSVSDLGSDNNANILPSKAVWLRVLIGGGIHYDRGE